MKFWSGVMQKPPRNDTIHATPMISFVLEDILLYLDDKNLIVCTPKLFTIIYCQHTTISTLV